MSIYEQFDNMSTIYTENKHVNLRQVDYDYHGVVENDDAADYQPIVYAEVIA